MSDGVAGRPAGQAQPNVSTLNPVLVGVLSNAAITHWRMAASTFSRRGDRLSTVPAGANGGVPVFATNPTHVILDINE